MVGDFVILNFVILGWWIVNPNMGALFMMVVCVWGEGGGEGGNQRLCWRDFLSGGENLRRSDFGNSNLFQS